jgi:ribosome assembly protein YihI (activator of Der GTPase)
MNIEQAAQNPIEDPVVAEVGADPIENNNPIEDLLNAIETQDYTSAESQFNDLIGDRLQSALDQAKVRVAASIYDGEESDEEEVDTGEEEVDYDFTDENDFDNAE